MIKKEKAKFKVVFYKTDYTKRKLTKFIEKKGGKICKFPTKDVDLIVVPNYKVKSLLLSISYRMGVPNIIYYEARQAICEIITKKEKMGK